MDERQANAKINQLLIILAEKQNAYRDATEQDDKASLQTEIDALQTLPIGSAPTV